MAFLEYCRLCREAEASRFQNLKVAELQQLRALRLTLCRVRVRRPVRALGAQWRQFDLEYRSCLRGASSLRTTGARTWDSIRRAADSQACAVSRVAGDMTPLRGCHLVSLSRQHLRPAENTAKVGAFRPCGQLIAAALWMELNRERPHSSGTRAARPWVAPGTTSAIRNSPHACELSSGLISSGTRSRGGSPVRRGAHLPMRVTAGSSERARPQGCLPAGQVLAPPWRRAEGEKIC